MEEEQEDSFYEAQEKDEDNDASLEIEELLEDSGGYDMESNIQHPITCRIGDKPIYKATMVKDVLNGDTQVSSADRLRRVRGYSKTPCSFENLDDENNLDLDDVLMLGDVVAAKLIPKDSATFAFIKIMAMKCKEGGKYATVIPSIKISQYSYDGCILESQLSRNTIYVKRTNTNELCKSLDGAFCVLVQFNNSNIEKEKVYRILEHLPISSTKVVNSMLIPYDETLM